MFPRYRELLSQVLHGEPAPVCPVAFWQHHPVADQAASTLLDSTLAFQSRHDCDVVKVTPASTFQLRDYGVTDAWRGDPLGRRWIGPGIVRNPEDWERLPSLDPWDGFLGRHLRCAADLRQRLDPAIPVVQSIFNPMFQAAVLGGDAWITHLASHPSSVEEGLRRITANTLRLVHALAEARIDGIYLVSQHARAGALPASAYERLGWPSDAACLASAREAMPFSFLHLHGHPVLLPPTPLAGRCVLHYSQDPGNPDPASLLQHGPWPISTGPAQDGHIRSGSPAQAHAEASLILERLKGPRFILGAACVLPLDTPRENIDAAIRAARTPRPDRPNSHPLPPRRP